MYFNSTEKRLSKRVEEAKGRLDKARTKVLEEEEGSAKVEVEWKGLEEEIKAHLKEDEERKERRRREEAREAGDGDMDDDPFVEEADSSEEVRVRVEVGKRRKVARNGRFTNGRAAAGEF